jgi:hypothetical protein
VIIDVIVGAASDLDEQHGERESGIILFGGSVGLIKPRQEPVQCVEHIAPILNVVCAARIGAGSPISRTSGWREPFQRRSRIGRVSLDQIFLPVRREISRATNDQGQVAPPTPPDTASDRGAAGLVPTLASLGTHTLRGVVTALPSVGVPEGRLRTLASKTSHSIFLLLAAGSFSETASVPYHLCDPVPPMGGSQFPCIREHFLPE